MVSAGAWLLPGAASLLAMEAWGGLRGFRPRAALALGLLSLALEPLPALATAASAVAAQVPDRRWNAVAVALLLALFRVRMDHLPAFPGTMGVWAALLGLVLVMAASQELLAADDAEGAGRALARGQAAWILFGLLSPAPLGWSGALLLAWQQPLLRLPLTRVLDRSPGRSLLAGALFLGLAGAPPLGAFNAYFQVLAPLMTEGAAVTSMHARLFSGTGLLAVLAILALLYQTGAFGYFYWSRVLPAAPLKGAETEFWRPVPEPWAWACVLFSLAWGLAEHWGWPGRLAFSALQQIGTVPNS